MDDVRAKYAFLTNEAFPQEGWYVILGGCKLVDDHAAHIKDWIGKHRLRQSLFNKGLIVWNIFPKIDFLPLQLYLTQQSQSFCL